MNKKVFGLILIVASLALFISAISGLLPFSLIGTQSIGSQTQNDFYQYSATDGTKIHLDSPFISSNGDITIKYIPGVVSRNVESTIMGFFKTNKFYFDEQPETASCSVSTNSNPSCSSPINATSARPDLYGSYGSWSSQQQTVPAPEKTITVSLADKAAYGKHDLTLSSMNQTVFRKIYNNGSPQGNTCACGVTVDSTERQDSGICISAGDCQQFWQIWSIGSPVFKIPVYFQNPVCDNFPSKGYVMSTADFVGGQTVNSSSLRQAMGNQEIIAFCPKKLPVVLLRPDTNEVIDTTIDPYIILEAGNYWTVPTGQAAMFWAVTTRPQGISWTCDVNQFLGDDKICHPVPALVHWCRITGQISADEGYCVTETTPRCADEQGNIVANAVYNVDRKECTVFIPTQTERVCIDSQGNTVADAQYNSVTGKCILNIPVTPNYVIPPGCNIIARDSAGNPTQCELIVAAPTINTVVPEGCRITETDAQGNPTKCVFSPIAGCEKGTLTTKDGKQVCIYQAPSEIEKIGLQLGLVQIITLLGSVAIFVVGIVLVVRDE